MSEAHLLSSECFALTGKVRDDKCSPISLYLKVNCLILLLLGAKKYTLACIIINTQYMIMSLILWIACFLITATWQSVVWAVERCDFVVGT